MPKKCGDMNWYIWIYSMIYVFFYVVPLSSTRNCVRIIYIYLEPRGLQNFCPHQKWQKFVSRSWGNVPFFRNCHFAVATGAATTFTLVHCVSACNKNASNICKYFDMHWNPRGLIKYQSWKRSLFSVMFKHAHNTHNFSRHESAVAPCQARSLEVWCRNRRCKALLLIRMSSKVLWEVNRLETFLLNRHTFPIMSSFMSHPQISRLRTYSVFWSWSALKISYFEWATMWYLDFNPNAVNWNWFSDKKAQALYPCKKLCTFSYTAAAQHRFNHKPCE